MTCRVQSPLDMLKADPNVSPAFRRALQFLPVDADTRAYEPEYDPNVSPGIRQAVGRCRAMESATEAKREAK